MRNFILVAALTSLTALPLHATEPTKDRRSKLICKGERIAGSNLERRVCMSKERWDEERQRAKDAMDFSGRPLPEPSPRGGG